MSRRTPLGRVLGLGSAKEGVSHWWTQRTTAIALVPLGLWFLVSFLSLVASGDTSHAAVTAWIATPLHSVLLTLLVLTSAWHSVLGVQVVIEDYVHLDWLKLVSLLASKFVHALLAAAGTLAVLRIAFGGAGA